MQGKHVLLGALFGFILSRAGATDYDAIANMFRLTDLHLVGVIGLAIAVNAVAFFAIRRLGMRSASGESIVLVPKPMTPGLIAGALLFGVGWALAGTCPGTALAQIGEGRWMGLATVAGIVAGAYLAQRKFRRIEAPKAVAPAE